MVKIIYVEHNGARHEVNVPEGENLMEGAVQQAAQPGRQAMAESGERMAVIVALASGLTLVHWHGACGAAL